jgi:ribosomal protein L17
MEALSLMGQETVSQTQAYTKGLRALRDQLTRTANTGTLHLRKIRRESAYYCQDAESEA